MKQKICDLTKLLDFEKQSYEEKLEVVNENFEVTLNDLNQKHCKELKNIAGQLCGVESELTAIKSDYEELKSSSKTQLQNFRTNIATYQSSFNKCCGEFNNELQNKESVIKEKESEIEALQEKHKQLEINHLEVLEDLVKKHAGEVKEIQYEMLKTVAQLHDEIEKEKRDCASKIKRIETEKQELETLARKHEKEKHELESQYETKIRQLEEDCNEAKILNEMQTKQRIDDVESIYKVKLELQEKEAEQILKECQAISEYNIIQCEVEKNHLKIEIKEKQEECEVLKSEKNCISEQFVELEKKFSELKCKFKEVTKQLEDTQMKLDNEIKKNEERNLCDERAYEITIKQLHVTIEALKNRLLNSDRDVEQLKMELNASESAKLATEDKCNKLQEEVQQLQNLNDELEIQNESTLKLTEEKIRKVESALQQKVDDFKATAEASTKKLEKELRDKDEKLNEAMEQLQQQQKMSDESGVLIKNALLELERLEAVRVDNEYKNNRLQNALERSEKQVETLTVNEKNTKEQLSQKEAALQNQILANEQFKIEMQRLKDVYEKEAEAHKKQISQLQKKNEEDVKLKDFYKNKLTETEKEIEEFPKLHKKYIEQSGKYDQLLHKYEILEARNMELEAKVKEQETLIGPFREQLQAYEMEHKALLNEKHDAENEAREMGLKYAAILGHQNQKQKIKYLVELQTKKFELIEVCICFYCMFK